MNVAIVEDEIENVQLMKEFLIRLGQDTKITFEVTVFKDGLEFIDVYKPKFDIVLMDIVMPRLDGMKAASKLREIDKNVVLIFVTNMSQFAVKGYEYNALSYIIKPLKYDSFVMVMKRAVEIVEANRDSFITVYTKTGVIRLAVDDIYYAEVFGHELTLHTVDKDYELKGTLTELAKETEKYYFIKCNVCYLVNPRHIEVTTKDAFIVKGQTLSISRLRRKECMDQLLKYFSKQGRGR